MIPIILEILVFTAASLAAWRGWKTLPIIARVAAVLAGVVGIVLFRRPVAGIMAVLLTVLVLSWVLHREGRPRRT